MTDTIGQDELQVTGYGFLVEHHAGQDFVVFVEQSAGDINGKVYRR